MIDGVLTTPVKIISTAGGEVLHAMKQTDTGACGFGEAYFSMVEAGFIKAWKRHRLMTLNLVVPVGKIRFVMFDDRQGSQTEGLIESVCLSRENYLRLTIPPYVWMGFQGLGKRENMLLNIADIPHKPDEADRLDLDKISFDWSLI